MSILIEFVFGIKVDVPNNRLIIHSYLEDGYAIKRLPFGDKGFINVTVTPENHSDSNQVTVDTELDVEICVVC